MLSYSSNIANKNFSEWKFYFLFLLLELFLGGISILNPLLILLPFIPVIMLFGFYWTFLRGPFFWIIVLVIATGLDSWGALFGGITIFHIGWFFSLVSLSLYYLFQNDKKFQLSTPINRYIIALFVIVGISLIYSPNVLSGLHLMARTLALVFFYFIIINFVDSGQKIKIILITLVILNILLSLLTFYQLLYENVLFFGTSTVQTETGEKIWRASGTFEDPNVEAVFLMVGMIYSFAVFAHSKENRFLKLAILLSLLITFAGMIATFSRTGWVALFIGLFVVLVFSKNKRLLVYSLLAFSSIVLGFIFFTPYGEFITSRFSSIFDIWNDPSITSRIGLIKSGLKMFADHPFLGVGYRGFPVLYDFYLDPVVPSYILYVKESHTLYITLLAELGVVGLITVLMWFIKVFKDNYRLIRIINNPFHHAILIGSFANFIALNVTFLFYGFLFPPFNLLWLVFALIYIYVGKEKYFENDSSIKR